MKVLVIGSGPIVIGQAAEFDYAGTQACKSLREEGHQVVLINSNPATIMTDEETADAVYIEPLTPEFCERVIARERPDGLLPTLGGQTGLNLATQLANRGILDTYGVRLLGTPLAAIQKAEDREEFRRLMREIKEPVPESWIIESDEQLRAVLDQVPYPCIVRPAYTLGGTGGGIAHDREELWETGQKGLKLSMRSQIMVERSLLGWKEIEYEVMRDRMGNCITICNMENFDPMGVHTGDSIVIAPSQTLSDIEYHMLRTASLKIIRALGIEGGCNVQLAVNPESFDYYVIEVNPRVSRSSALASKATGYPIARVSAKIAVGRTLDEIENQVTGTTKACFEPALDYCVVKIPRWPFDKFASGDRTLFTQMKATGEVMAIDRSFEAAFMKAIRGLEIKYKDLRHPRFCQSPDDELREAIRKPTDERLWAIAEGLRRGWSVQEVNQISKVDKWFLQKIVKLLEVERSLEQIHMHCADPEAMRQTIREAFLIGYPSPTIESMIGITREFKNDLASLRFATGPAIRLALQDSSAGTGLDGPDLDSDPNASEASRAFGAKHDDFESVIREVEEHLDSDPNASEASRAYGAKHDDFEPLIREAEEHLDSDPEASEASRAFWAKHDDFEPLIREAEEHLDSDPEASEASRAFEAMHDVFERLIREVEANLDSDPNASEASRAFWAKYDVSDPVFLARFFCAGEIARQKVQPVFKMVDTCAGEFESQTPYYYGTFEDEDDVVSIS